MSNITDQLYIVTYDVGDRKRWRRVFKLMNGYGAWLQLSVFQCRLSRKRLAALKAALREIVTTGEDHVLILDLGPADSVEPRVESLGKPYEAVAREAIVI